jgi:hypothetical protein
MLQNISARVRTPPFYQQNHQTSWADDELSIVWSPGISMTCWTSCDHMRESVARNKRYRQYTTSLTLHLAAHCPTLRAPFPTKFTPPSSKKKSTYTLKAIRSALFESGVVTKNVRFLPRTPVDLQRLQPVMKRSRYQKLQDYRWQSYICGSRPRFRWGTTMRTGAKGRQPLCCYTSVTHKAASRTSMRHLGPRRCWSWFRSRLRQQI